MQIYLHQTHHKIGQFSEIFTYIQQVFNERKDDSLPSAHFFPELFLNGYPLQDLCFSKIFIQQYQKLLNDINDWSTKQKSKAPIHLIMGGLKYDLDNKGFPLQIFNSAYHLEISKEIKHVYDKRLLPNYDIFDEEKYYTPGEENCILNIEGLNIGVLICEDMWHSSVHAQDPVKDFCEQLNEDHTKLDIVANLSASPYHIGKSAKRLKRARSIANLTNATFLYVNKVGLEDEILFDGGSFILSSGSKNNVIGPIMAKHFAADVIKLELAHNDNPNHCGDSDKLSETENTWESLFRPRITSNEESEFKKSLAPLSEDQLDEVYEALLFSLKDYADKNGFNSFCVALSGGIDSSLVLVLAKHLCDRYPDKYKVETVFMPGLYSSTLSYDMSSQLCDNLEIKPFNLPIKFLHSTVKNAFENSYKKILEGVSDENVQSRLRGLLLCALSNSSNSLIINTSNKSEVAVGYSTMYGDSVGGLSLLGDLYKTEVFALSRHINKKHDNVIPEQIITRPPSAELRADQTDEQTLPPYDRMDLILELLLSFNYTKEEIVKLGLNPEEVTRLARLIDISEYKRRQFCPIVKLNAKSFGFGHRLPISKEIL